jgi:hypothetical protein
VTNSVLAKLAVNISANNAAFLKGIADSNRGLNSFVGNVTKLAGSLGIAFGTQQIASFALEISKISGEAQGVRAAFERLPQSTKLMNDLKDATGGTVSELDLMKRAVQANNFEISLAALPRLLEFATLRAQQTGQSVDYLVDSIVTGIGRKSKLILDNLGISAVQLNEALGGASTAASTIGEVADAVGAIAEKNLANMASFSDNASTKLQKLGASWVNMKVAIGDAANGTGILGKSVDALSASLDLLASKDITWFEKLSALLGGPGGASSAVVNAVINNQKRMREEAEKQKQIIQEVDRAYVEFNKNIDAYGRAITTHIFRTELLAEFQKRLVDEQKSSIETIETLKQKQDELNTLFDQTDKNDQKELSNIGAQIIAIGKQIEALEKLRKSKEDPLKGKLGFFPDLEAEGSTNPNLRNEQAANDAAAFRKELEKVALTAEFAGGAVLQMEENTTQAAQNIKNEWIDIGPMIANSIADIAYQFGQAAVGADDFGKAILNSLAGFAQAFGAALIATGIGKITFDSFSGPAMIAAGAALVAVAGATKGIINNRPNLSRSGGSGSRSSFSAGGSPQFSSVSGSMQNSAPQLITILKGADLWVMQQNYQSGNQWTRAVG